MLNAVVEQLVAQIKWGSHPDPNFDKKYPILTIKDMIELYKDGHINSKNMTVDLNKLNFLNKKRHV